MIRAIETFYKGYRFRSRLEARWAVFFDAMEFNWVYEPEGFVLEDGTKYLPDFKLLNGPYVEVKPSKLTAQERHVVELFGNDEPILIAVGEPCPIGYEVIEPLGDYCGCIALCYHEGEVGNWEFASIGWEVYDDRLEYACNMAKSARFEHGESPLVRNAPNTNLQLAASRNLIRPFHSPAKRTFKPMTAEEFLAPSEANKRTLSVNLPTTNDTERDERRFKRLVALLCSWHGDDAFTVKSGGQEKSGRTKISDGLRLQLFELLGEDGFAITPTNLQSPISNPS